MFSIFLLLIGMAAFASGIRMLSAGRRVRAWPVVPGRVIEKSVGPSTTTGASRPGRYYEPRLTYSYTVDGKTYVGQRIGLVTAAYDEGKARRIVSDFPESVTVHYNPRDPGDACLQRPPFVLALIALLTGAICLCAGIGSLFVKQA